MMKKTNNSTAIHASISRGQIALKMAGTLNSLLTSLNLCGNIPYEYRPPHRSASGALSPAQQKPANQPQLPALSGARSAKSQNPPLCFQ
jgi:hypothetical protein